MTLNDFKSVEGDRRMGIGSLPVRLGVPLARAHRVLDHGRTAVRGAGPAAVVGRALARGGGGRPAGGPAGADEPLPRRPEPAGTWYSGFGVTLYVIGMLVSAFALRFAGSPA